MLCSVGPSGFFSAPDSQGRMWYSVGQGCENDTGHYITHTQPRKPGSYYVEFEGQSTEA